MPARARSEGDRAVMSWSAQRTLPSVGCSAPATHFISVLLPEPVEPVRPWNSFSLTVSAAPSSAVSLPKTLTMPLASRSGMRAFLRRPAETADALPLAEHEADEAKRAKQDHQQQQYAENDRPDIAVIVREPEADAFDDDGADHRADQRAGSAEQAVKHHLRREHDARDVGPHEPLVGRIE